jgi:hypothetical protein
MALASFRQLWQPWVRPGTLSAFFARQTTKNRAESSHFPGAVLIVIASLPAARRPD